MRILFTFLLFATSTISFSQALDSTTTDTSYYANMQARVIVNYAFINGSKYQHGYYREFDSTGIILVEGYYQAHLDSIECIDCFTINHYDSSLIQYTKAHYNEIRTGIWKYYYPNGHLKMEGEYSPKIHEDRSSFMLAKGCNSVMGPVGIGIQFLEHGPWSYYNEFGEITNRKWYYQGRLIHDEIAHCSEPIEELRGNWTWAYRGSVVKDKDNIKVFLFLRTSNDYDFRIIYESESNCGTDSFDFTASGYWKYKNGILMLFPNTRDSIGNPHNMITQEGLIKLNSSDKEIITKYNPPVFFKCEQKKMSRKFYFKFFDPCIEEIWKSRGFVQN